MTPRILHSLLPLALATGVCAQTVAPASELAAITRDQKGVDSRVGRLAAAYRAVLDEMRKLGAGGEDIALVEAALAELASLREEDMEKILAQLESGDTASLSDAYAGQKLVAARLRSLVVKLQLRQQELGIARRAGELAERQAANRPPTEALKPGTAPGHVARVKVTAEQQAIGEETLSLVEQVRRLRADPQNTPSESLERLSKPEALDALKASAEAASDGLGAGNFAAASAQQALIFDRLSRLSELGRRTPPPAEAARAAGGEMDALIDAQKNKPDAAAQAELAAQAEAMRPQVDGLAAAAGAQLRQAAEAMRKNAEKPAAAAAKTAEEKLAAARELLDKQAKELAATETAKPAATPEAIKKEAEDLVRFAREAQALKVAQEQLVARIASPPPPAVALVDNDQIAISRRTAALQQQVQAAGHEAAAPIGQAAVRMAESLSTAQPGPTPEGAAASRQTAVERLAQAVELLTAAAKKKQEESALAQAGEEAKNAADKLGEASDELAKAEEEKNAPGKPAENASGKPAENEPGKAAQDAIAAAQQALNRAGQAAAALPPEAKEALSESWKKTEEAAKAAQQGDATAAKTAAKAAAEAAQKAQAQLAQALAQAKGPGRKPGTEQGKPQGPAGPSSKPPSKSGQGEGSADGELAGHGADAAAGSAQMTEGLSPRERDALAAARRQPVPRGYSGMVESYLENLSSAQ